MYPVKFNVNTFLPLRDPILATQNPMAIRTDLFKAFAPRKIVSENYSSKFWLLNFYDVGEPARKSNFSNINVSSPNVYVLYLVQLGKNDGSKVSNLETSAWQRQSTARSNLGVECKSRWSNLICLAILLNAAGHVIPSVLSSCCLDIRLDRSCFVHADNDKSCVKWIFCPGNEYFWLAYGWQGRAFELQFFKDIWFIIFLLGRFGKHLGLPLYRLQIPWYSFSFIFCVFTTRMFNWWGLC